MKRFLITTADERTWPKDQPVLFLGEWCRLYNRKNAWKDLDTEVVAYHWDDRIKLHQDYQYLQNLYEELLQELTMQLNVIHGTHHSLRYWRILIGPWLGYFVQMLFDRWAMIERAVSQYEIAGVRILQTPSDLVIPNDMAVFQQLLIGDSWNQSIYGQLLRENTHVAIEDLPFDETWQHCEVISEAVKVEPFPLRDRVRRSLESAAAWVFKTLAGNDEAFFISTYLPIKQNLLLQWQLGQIPKIWRSFPAPRVQSEESKRLWSCGNSTTKGFECIVRTMIPKHIPTLYLEGYANLRKIGEVLPWPQTPRVIFTSNAYNSDDVFKAWAAEKVEADTPIVLGQHGGNFGMALWGFTEDHQHAISDSWISWGWEVEDNPKIRPVGNLKMIGRNMCNTSWDTNGDALLVEMAMSRYSYHLYSVPVASQWLDYFEDQSRFVAALPDYMRGQLLVRLYIHDYGWCQEQRWQDRFPHIRIDNGVAPMVSLIGKSRLYISTYNATTFLETLTMNIPTIMFWNPNHWELRQSAKPYFEQLKEVGIFHETPESAARQMARVWDDVAAWWYCEPVQTVREAFCHRYSRLPERPLEDLERIFSQFARQPRAMAS